MATALNEAIIDTDSLSFENIVYSEYLAEELNEAFKNCQAGKVVTTYLLQKHIQPYPLTLRLYLHSNPNIPIPTLFIISSLIYKDIGSNLEENITSAILQVRNAFSVLAMLIPNSSISFLHLSVITVCVALNGVLVIGVYTKELMCCQTCVQAIILPLSQLRFTHLDGGEYQVSVFIIFLTH